MKIRTMIAEDRAEWLRMRCELWPECSAERHALEIREWASQSDGLLLVAESGEGGLCGFIEVSIRRDHVDGTTSSPVPYVEGWYVDGKYRGRGIGGQLLAAVEQWARDHGFKEIASDAELENHESIAAHAACGFIETCRAVHFVRRIDL
jgi:aminoglycoside 6'-N-acetyltransferase I